MQLVIQFWFAAFLWASPAGGMLPSSQELRTHGAERWLVGTGAPSNSQALSSDMGGSTWPWFAAKLFVIGLDGKRVMIRFLRACLDRCSRGRRVIAAHLSHAACVWKVVVPPETSTSLKAPLTRGGLERSHSVAPQRKARCMLTYCISMEMARQRRSHWVDTSDVTPSRLSYAVTSLQPTPCEQRFSKDGRVGGGTTSIRRRLGGAVLQPRVDKPRAAVETRAQKLIITRFRSKPMTKFWKQAVGILIRPCPKKVLANHWARLYQPTIVHDMLVRRTRSIRKPHVQCVEENHTIDMKAKSRTSLYENCLWSRCPQRSCRKNTTHAAWKDPRA